MALMENQEKLPKAIAKDFEYFKSMYNVIEQNSLPSPNFEGIDEALAKILE